MPSTLRLPDGGYMRHTDARQIIEYLSELKCVEVTGFSNIGKSSLLRLLAQSDVWLQELGEAARMYLPIYVDCNRMLEMTDHGFYELVLRCLQENDDELRENAELSAAYETLITPASEFQIPLSFNKGFNAALNHTERILVFLFDEFDEPFAKIDSRVFLNLRANKDRFESRLVYVTATVLPLVELRPGDHCGEFCELFTHQPWRLAPLTRTDVEQYIFMFGKTHEAPFLGVDVDFIYQWAGGHPGLLEVTCNMLATMLRNTVANGASGIESRWAIHRAVIHELRNSPNLISECAKIWGSCNEAEQEALRNLVTGADTDPKAVNRLCLRHVLIDTGGKVQAFSRLFMEYLQHHQVTLPGTQSAGARLAVDLDSGEVLVDDLPVETLTRLEYKLMLLLYENVGKIVDKYQIVTGVWGDDYIDEVDDARIEKLVSRLRQKIEPDPANPQFLSTIRGRGYRLSLG